MAQIDEVKRTASEIYMDCDTLSGSSDKCRRELADIFDEEVVRDSFPSDYRSVDRVRSEITDPKNTAWVFRVNDTVTLVDYEEHWEKGEIVGFILSQRKEGESGWGMIHTMFAMPAARKLGLRSLFAAMLYEGPKVVEFIEIRDSNEKMLRWFKGAAQHAEKDWAVHRITFGGIPTIENVNKNL